MVIMLKLNKYLRELGVDEKNFYFRCDDNRYIPDEDTGIPQSHTWDMSGVLAMIIYTYLKEFKKFNCAYPTNLTEDKWDKILDDMIEGFASIIKGQESNRARKKQRRALSLFKTWFFALWW